MHYTGTNKIIGLARLLQAIRGLGYPLAWGDFLNRASDDCASRLIMLFLVQPAYRNDSIAVMIGLPHADGEPVKLFLFDIAVNPFLR